MILLVHKCLQLIFALHTCLAWFEDFKRVTTTTKFLEVVNEKDNRHKKWNTMEQKKGISRQICVELVYFSSNCNNMGSVTQTNLPGSIGQQ